jgi:hypothetical protein
METKTQRITSLPPETQSTLQFTTFQLTRSSMHSDPKKTYHSIPLRKYLQDKKIPDQTTQLTTSGGKPIIIHYRN